MSNAWKFSIWASFVLLLVSLPGEAPAAWIRSRTFDMASLFYEADVVVEVDELGYTGKDGRRTGKVRIQKVYKGAVQPGKEMVVSMPTSYTHYIGPIRTRLNRVPRIPSRMRSLMFLRKAKEYPLMPVPSGIKRIRENDILKYVEGGFDGGSYVLVPQNPEFIKLNQGQAYTLAELRKDLELAEKRAEEFRKAYDAEDLEKLQAFVPMLPSQDARNAHEASLLSRKAVQKIIEKGDKDLLSEVLRDHRGRCEWYVVRALETVIRDPGQREQAMRKLDRPRILLDKLLDRARSSLEIVEKGALSTGEDTYKRVLEIFVSDLAPKYRTGSPIPIAVRIKNHGPKGSDAGTQPSHPTAQLFPHLTVWVEHDSKVTTAPISLPIENRILIKQGDTFERTIDLAKCSLLSSPGEYLVSVGHRNDLITDIGDWTGTLRSRSQRIKIEPIRTVLKISKTHFDGQEPIVVDVYVENQTKQDVVRRQFSPASSSIGLPDFVFVRVPGGRGFSIPPGLFGDDWDSWYQPVAGKASFSVGTFRLPAGKRIHLLQGDLREMVSRARDHCSRALDEKVLLERPENAGTKKEYQKIVQFADEFLRGGTYDIHVRAYSTSEKVRVQVNQQGAKGSQLGR